MHTTQQTPLWFALYLVSRTVYGGARRPARDAGAGDAAEAACDTAAAATDPAG